MGISNPEIKKLYGLSAGRCNICKANVFENDVHIGEMAHVIAKSAGGPRGTEALSNGLNSYENLILLCANHHLEVDQNTQKYSVERLHEIKQSHEKSISSQFDSPKDRKNDSDFLNLFMRCVPFTRLQYFTEHLPLSVNIDLSLVGDMFEALCKDNPHLYPLNDQILQRKFESFIRSYYLLWSEISGFAEVDNREQANYSQADDRGYIHLEKKFLPYNTHVEIGKRISDLRLMFLSSYSELIDFLRSDYKNVKLNSYD